MTLHAVNKSLMACVAVVTGSNKGIGLEIVKRLCKEFDGDVYSGGSGGGGGGGVATPPPPPPPPPPFLTRNE